MIGSLFFAIGFYSATTILCLLYVPFLLGPRSWMAAAARLWIRVSLAILRITTGIDHRMTGVERLPEGPFILACKHQSAWETLALTLLVPNAVYVLKKELMRIPFFGWYLWKVGHVAVDRSAGASALKKMVTGARAALDEGHPVIIFPQGTRTAPGTRKPYLPGVAALYTGTGATVVPAALNSGSFWPRRKFRMHRGTITLQFLEPIEPGLDRKEFMKLLEERIESATNRLEAPDKA